MSIVSQTQLTVSKYYNHLIYFTISFLKIFKDYHEPELWSENNRNLNVLKQPIHAIKIIKLIVNKYNWIKIVSATTHKV